MKTIWFRTSDEKTRDEIADKVLEIVTKGKFSEEYRLRDITIRKDISRVNNNDFSIAISAYDCVPASYYISAYMNNDNDDNSYASIVDSEIFSESLKIPRNVKIGTNWTEDRINEYKIIKQNKDKIVDMIFDGVSAEEIGKTLGIHWTEEDSYIFTHGDEFCPHWESKKVSERRKGGIR